MLLSHLDTNAVLCWLCWDTDSLIYQSFYCDSLLQFLNLDNPHHSKHFYSTKLSFHISIIKAATFVRTKLLCILSWVSFLLSARINIFWLEGGFKKKKRYLLLGQNLKRWRITLFLITSENYQLRWTDLNLLMPHTQFKQQHNTSIAENLYFVTFEKPQKATLSPSHMKLTTGKLFLLCKSFSIDLDLFSSFLKSFSTDHLCCQLTSCQTPPGTWGKQDKASKS